MVTTLNSKPTGAREAGYEMMQYISTRINIGTVAAPSGGGAQIQRVGVLPTGALLTGVHSRVATAFATAGAITVAIGQSGTYSDLATGISTSLGGAAIIQPFTNITQPLTADLDVWASITSGATAGDMYISVWFQKPVA